MMANNFRMPFIPFTKDEQKKIRGILGIACVNEVRYWHANTTGQNARAYSGYEYRLFGESNWETVKIDNAITARNFELINLKFPPLSSQNWGKISNEVPPIPTSVAVPKPYKPKRIRRPDRSMLLADSYDSDDCE